MTEYEIADLALSKTMQLQGAVSQIQVQMGTIGDGIQLFMAVLFGFLAAAYFIGARLERRQALIFSALYILWQIWTLAAISARGTLMLELTTNLAELRGSSGELVADVPQFLVVSLMLILPAALSASLYFMWSVRHPKSE
jgi:small-conductance mechanosensitive channel